MASQVRQSKRRRVSFFRWPRRGALPGAAERERDGFIRVSELIDYVSRVVPQQTNARQNPRIAGNFEGALAMASLPAELRIDPKPAATLLLTGPPGAIVYLDRQFRGAIRPTGDLSIDSDAGAHAIAIGTPRTEPFEQPVSLTAGQNMLDLTKSSEFALLRLRGRSMRSVQIPNHPARSRGRPRNSHHGRAGGHRNGVRLRLRAIDHQHFEAAYVSAFAETFHHLRTLRTGDPSLEAKALFCQARAEIAANRFVQAIDLLNRSLAIDAEFACSYNALGVTLARTNKAAEALAAFQTAAKLTPAWALPPMQTAQQLISSGDIRGAVPHLENAVRLNPNAVGIYWSLARVHRTLGNAWDFARVAMGLFYESIRDRVRAAQAYYTYLLLATNYIDSAEVRRRAQQVRAPAQPPSLRKN